MRERPFAEKIRWFFGGSRPSREDFQEALPWLREEARRQGLEVTDDELRKLYIERFLLPPFF